MPNCGRICPPPQLRAYPKRYVRFSCQSSLSSATQVLREYVLAACEPTNQGYAPAQPIKYSHAVHAGAMQIDCQYCHFGAERGRHELEVLAAARDWKAAGRGVALATVVKTWGSSPRPPGSHLVVCDDGSFLGSVSGGCVEGAVVEEALGVMKAGLSKVLEFGVTHEQAWEVGLACGGTVRIFVEPVQ